MTEALEQQREETAPVETPAALPTDAPIGSAPVSPDSELDELLRQFDEATTKPAAAEPAADNATEQVSQDELTNFLNGLDSDRTKITELEGTISGLRAAEFQAQERRAAEQWAGELQDALVRSNPNLDDSFVMDRLKIMAAENPGVLESAWQYRNLTDADLAQAQRDYRSAEVLYQRVLAQPDTEPQKQNALRHLEQRGAQLQAMLGSRQVIRNVRNEIRKRADSVRPNIDVEATLDRDAVAQAIREGATKFVPEEKIDFATMTDKEFAEWCRKNIRN